LVDDFGCALFGPVLFVTLSYYCMQFLPLDPLYGDDYQVVCVASSVLYLLCLLSCGALPASANLDSLFSCSEICICNYRLQPFLLMVCLWHVLVLICSLHQGSVLTRTVFSQGNALHQQQPACYSKDMCVSPLVPPCTLNLYMAWSTLSWHFCVIMHCKYGLFKGCTFRTCHCSMHSMKTRCTKHMPEPEHCSATWHTCCCRDCCCMSLVSCADAVHQTELLLFLHGYGTLFCTNAICI